MSPQFILTRKVKQLIFYGKDSIYFDHVKKCHINVSFLIQSTGFTVLFYHRVSCNKRKHNSSSLETGGRKNLAIIYVQNNNDLFTHRCTHTQTHISTHKYDSIFLF